jgi:hypothetical protein
VASSEAAVKVWEDEWKAHVETYTDEEGHEHNASWCVVDTDRAHVVADCLSEDAARLVSAAPDMARVLLAVEWIRGRDGEECCSSCDEIRPDHDEACALDAALRKAGVRE